MIPFGQIWYTQLNLSRQHVWVKVSFPPGSGIEITNTQNLQTPVLQQRDVLLQ
jgi:hypothetical protein